VSELLEPCDARELAEALREAAARGRSISLGGNFSKQEEGEHIVLPIQSICLLGYLLTCLLA